MATILEATVTVDRWNPITRVPMARRTWKSAKVSSRRWGGGSRSCCPSQVRLAVDSRGRKGIEVEAGKQKLYYSLHVPHIGAWLRWVRRQRLTRGVRASEGPVRL